MTTFEQLPSTLPVFPLRGVVLLPGEDLPLQIFEPRYLEMFNDALRTDRLLGIIQPKEASVCSGDKTTLLHDLGCAGRITSFTETDDGRQMVTLRGISRFRIKTEVETPRPYRLVQPLWKEFAHDFQEEERIGLDRSRLNALLESYFELQGLYCDWDAVQSAPSHKLITLLSMVCPLDPEEKQALLEAETAQKRGELFMQILEMCLKCQSAAPAKDSDPDTKH